MPPTFADLAASPDHYLYAFDGPDAVFVPMDRAAYRRSIFLDDRISPAADGTLRVAAAALLPAAPSLEIGWIFHMAHCGSTLLARALDEAGGNLVLREPLALRQAALGADPGQCDLVLAQLGKRYDPALRTLVKANVPVNFMLPAIAARQPAAPGIVLWLDLEDYLCAILRSDNHRAWLSNVTTLLAPWLGDLTGTSDAHRAALLWSAQLERFGAALQAMPNLRTLDAERFYANSAAVLGRVTRHLGVACDDATIAAIAAGPLFATYSKRPEFAFSNADRLARKADTRDALRAELDDARDRIGERRAALVAALNEAAI